MNLDGVVNLDTVVNGLDVDPFVDVLLNGPFQAEADMNLDGAVNGLDVDPFVDALLSGPYQPEADMNDDQVVNGLDVDPFVAAVVGGAQQIPEPSTFLLASLGSTVLLLLHFLRSPETKR